MKIKVVHFTNLHPPFDGRIFERECSCLAGEGYEVTLVALGDKDSTFSRNGVTIVTLKGASESRRWKMTVGVKNIYEYIISLNADIYHFHDPVFLKIALKLKRRKKIVIFDSHECYPLQILDKGWIPLPLRRCASMLYKMYETYVCKRIDAVIFVCTINGKDFFKGRSRRCVYLLNTPILKKFPVAEQTIKPNKICCPLSNLCYDRGTTNLIKAIGMTSGTLLLAGKFVNKCYEESVRGMREWSKVDYKGVITHDEVKKMISESVAGAELSLFKGQNVLCDVFATKVYEYMASSIPVIVSNNRFNVENVGRLKCGLCVPPDDPKKIAEAFQYIFDHPREAAEMGKNGRMAVERHYSWERESEKLINLYSDLIEEYKL